MLKILAAILLIGTFSAAGFLASRVLKKRTEQLKAVNSGLCRLETYINYRKKELSEILPLCFESADFLHFKSGQTFIGECSLKKRDKELLSEFFSSLGLSDGDTEKERLKAYKKLFAASLVEAENEYSGKSRVYKTSGICIGTALAIFIM